MGFAVELFFDEPSERRIREFFKRLSDLGLSTVLYELGSRPHISLAVYHHIDPEHFSEKLQGFVADKKAFQLRFESLSVFPTDPSVIFIAPCLNDELWNLHRDYHNVMAEFSDTELSYYFPNQWIPHCAIAMDVLKQNVARVVEEIAKDFTPFESRVDEIALVEFRPVKHLKTFGLKKSLLNLNQSLK